MSYSFRLAARVLLYAPSHTQDSTHHGLCYTSRGVLAGTRNSSFGSIMKDRSDDPSHHERTLLPQSYICLHACTIIYVCFNDIIIIFLVFSQDTSQCAAVSLLDVTNISFDSFLVGTATLIPQFIFDSIDTMQHDKRPVTSVSSTSGIIDNCLLSEVSHNPLETTRSPDEISPSKQILDLLCGIDVTENKDHPGVYILSTKKSHTHPMFVTLFKFGKTLAKR